jgi:hypothetical protein
MPSLLESPLSTLQDSLSQKAELEPERPPASTDEQAHASLANANTWADTRRRRGNVHVALQGLLSYFPFEEPRLEPTLSDYLANAPFVAIFIQMLSAERMEQRNVIFAQLLRTACPVGLVRPCGVSEVCSATSAIFVVQTYRSAEVVHLLDRRILLDRFGFWLVSTPEEQRALFSYCRRLELMPQECRRPFVNRLPWRPLVVELSRSTRILDRLASAGGHKDTKAK